MRRGQGTQRPTQERRPAQTGWDDAATRQGMARNGKECQGSPEARNSQGRILL